MPRAITVWLGLGGLAIAILPWYALEGDDILAVDWLHTYPDAATGPALYQIVAAGRAWLLPPELPWLAILAIAVRRGHDRAAWLWLAAGGGLGLALLLLQGFAIIHSGPAWGWVA